MTWAKIDDKWPRDRKGKAIKAGPEGRDLYVCGLAFCNANLTDGLIPDAVVPTLAPGNRHPRRTAQLLVEIGLWEAREGGFQVHDFTDWNPTAAEIEAERAANRERQTVLYKQWRNAVFDQDDRKCRKCGNKSDHLHAHHIKPFRQYPQFRVDVSNGLTLCQSCHRLEHSGRTTDYSG